MLNNQAGQVPRALGIANALKVGSELPPSLPSAALSKRSLPQLTARRRGWQQGRGCGGVVGFWQRHECWAWNMLVPLPQMVTLGGTAGPFPAYIVVPGAHQLHTAPHEGAPHGGAQGACTLQLCRAMLPH